MWALVAVLVAVGGCGEAGDPGVSVDDANQLSGDAQAVDAGGVGAPDAAVQPVDTANTTADSLDSMAGDDTAAASDNECSEHSDCAGLVANLCLGETFCNKSNVPWRCGLVPGSTVTCDPAKDTACQANLCDPNSGKCQLINRPDATPCSVADPCVVKSACASGECASTSGASWCQCQKTADCGVFDDGDPCTGTLFCDQTTFPFTCRVNVGSVVNCATDKDTQCRKNLCNPKVGACALTPLADKTACDDGDKTTAGDHCSAGVCESGTEVAPCSKTADCAAKEDGDVCNGVLFCHIASGKCLLNPASVVNCPSALDTACLVNTCVASTGQCVPNAQKDGTKCPDGDPCTVNELCKDGECAPEKDLCKCQQDADCKDDGNFCNGTMFCDKTDQSCAVDPTTVVVCQSVNDSACLKSACVPLSGACTLTAIEDVKSGSCPQINGPLVPNCRFEERGPNDVKLTNVGCQDGNVCTAGDVCAAGVCTAGNVVCECATDADCASKDDGNKCNGVYYCDKSQAKATCVFNPASKVLCAPVFGSPCLANSCDPITGNCGLVAKADEAPCDDGKFCTVGDACKDQKCAGSPNLCADSAHCTLDKCFENVGCTHEKKPCDDGNGCTVDSCDAGTGKCVHDVKALLGKACNDGDGCTVADLCAASADGKAALCKAGAGAICPDTTGVCAQNQCVSTQSGQDFKCVLVPKKDGDACDDGDACSLEETCTKGKCVAGDKERLFSKIIPAGGGDHLRLDSAAPWSGGYALVGRRWKVSGGAVQSASWWLARLEPGGVVGTADAVLDDKSTTALRVGVVPLGSGIAVASSHKSGTETLRARVIRKNAKGATVWDKTYGNKAENTVFQRLKAHSQGGLLLAAQTVGKGARVLLLSSNGSVEWVASPSVGDDKTVADVAEHGVGQVVAIGSHAVANGGKRGWLAVLSATGKVQVERTFGGLA